MSKVTDEKLIELIYKYKGFVTQVSQAAGISRLTFYNRMHKNEDIETALADAREQIVDFAESKLLELIQDGNINAIMFFLKTQAKHKGYYEKQEIDQKSQVINIIEVPELQIDETEIQEITRTEKLPN